MNPEDPNCSIVWQVEILLLDARWHYGTPIMVVGRSQDGPEEAKADAIKQIRELEAHVLRLKAVS